MTMMTAERELLQALYDQVDIISNKGKFYNQYGFYLEEYLSNRAIFTLLCRDHADKIGRTVKRTGIARTVGGSVGVLSGVAAILGIVLAPVSGGASLGLTIGGIAGGIAGGGNNAIAGFIKDSRIRSDIRKIEELLRRFEDQEKVIFKLLEGVQWNFNRLRQLRLQQTPSNLGIAFQAGAGALKIGTDLKALENSVSAAVKFAEFSKKMSDAACSAECVKSLSAAAGNLVDEVAAPGFRTVITAGSTTAKVFSGAFAAIGIVVSIVDIANAVKDIKGSEVADAYRNFANQYEYHTETLIRGIEHLSGMM